MKTPQLLIGFGAAVLLTSGCNRHDVRADAREVATDARQTAGHAASRLGDSWLTTKVQTQLFADADVDARRIVVSTNNSVVTLRGRVTTDQERQQALQIANTTDGVTQVRDQLVVENAPEGAAAADRDPSIVTRIQARYFSDPQIKGRDISVSAANGIVILTGDVRSEAEKEQAIAIARGSEGVTGVDARLTVQPIPTSSAVATSGTLPSTSLDDGRVMAEIQARYFVDEMVKPRRIDVDVRQGVATLRGEVASEGERAQALRLARTTPGVERVEDSLTVNAGIGAPPAPAPTSAAPSDAAVTRSRPAGTIPNDDKALSSRVQSALPSSVTATAKDGVVLLEGTVPTRAAKEKALTAARRTAGVTQVVDRVRVGR